MPQDCEQNVASTVPPKLLQLQNEHHAVDWASEPDSSAAEAAATPTAYHSAKAQAILTSVILQTVQHPARGAILFAQHTFRLGHNS